MITEFQGKNRFLSNFYELENPITFENLAYSTSEHLYVALKTMDHDSRRIISTIPWPGEAKKLGRKLKIRPDWEDVKFQSMHLVLILKFAANPRLMHELIETLPQELVEGNRWHDNEWGNCTCKKCSTIEGKNRLGFLLMQVRFDFELIAGKKE
jgi:ribA/ribD-fused uncharacterized protein